MKNPDKKGTVCALSFAHTAEDLKSLTLELFHKCGGYLERNCFVELQEIFSKSPCPLRNTTLGTSS